MTAPDVALAKAIRSLDVASYDWDWVIDYDADKGVAPVAEAIIAALNAQGWRITSAEPGVGSGTTTDCPIEGVHEHPFRGPHRFREWYDGPRMGGPFEDMSLDEFVDRTRLSVALIEQVAVRAALEGLVVEVVARKRQATMGPGQDSTDVDVAWAFDEAIALIRARLADLP